MDTITESLKNFFTSISAGLGDWGLQLIGAIAALIIGLWIVRMLMKVVSRVFDKANIVIYFLWQFLIFCVWYLYP